MSARQTIDFGIDLGVSKSAIAVWDGSRARIVRNQYDEIFTPTAIYIGRTGNVIVGSKAKAKMADGRSSQDAYAEFTRRIGANAAYAFKSSGLVKKPEEMVAEVLKSLKRDVLQRTGQDISAAALTIPAAFGKTQCVALKKAAELAGLTQSPFVQKPVAAALAYGFQSSSAKSTLGLVFDFGGGTFDAAVIKAEDGDIQVVNHGGDPFLGGSDIDWGVIDKLVVPSLTDSYNLPEFKRENEKWRIAFAKIKHSVELAKIDLSRSSEAFLDGCVFEDADGNEVALDGFKLTQNQLSDIAEPLIARAVDTCKDVLKEKNLSASDIERAVLVGGPTGAPYFRDILSDKLGVPLDYSADPQTAIVRGAAIFAGTQQLWNGSEPSRPIRSGKFKIVLDYRPVGPDDDPAVAGEVVPPVGAAIAGCTIEFFNRKSKWSSGVHILNSAGRFRLRLRAEGCAENIFDITLRDAAGARLITDLSVIGYTIGRAVEKMVVCNDIFLRLRDGNLVVAVPKGTTYPFKKTLGNCTLGDLWVETSDNSCELVLLAHESRLGSRRSGGLMAGLRFDFSRSRLKGKLLYEADCELTFSAKEPGALKVEIYIPLVDEVLPACIDFSYAERAGDAAPIESLVSALKADAPICNIIDAAIEISWDKVDGRSFSAIRSVLISYLLTSKNAPLVMLSLPTALQAELALFSHLRLPGLDRTVCRKATPQQVIRRLSGKFDDRSIDDQILASYNFSSFKKNDWMDYFAVCSTPIAAAKAFLFKDASAGGFTDDEITNLALRNPQLIDDCIPPARISPDTAVALLISGKAQSLWQTYKFERLGKEHWRELLLHTNPDSLPEACRPFIENRDGNGFTADELLNMARSCHVLINSLDPNKVPFNVAYELYLTGRADLLWKNYPFAMLDKSEWRKILTNPQIPIPDMFIEVARSNRFRVDELCDLATKNDKLLPVLVEINIPPKNAVDLLLARECDYLWAHYHFTKFGPGDWERLILGLRQGQILKPNAMSALSSCRGITEIQATRILNKDTVYCPHLPLTSVSPDMVVEILMRGKGYFLWDKYDFSRLSDEQWLRLLGGITGSVHKVEEKFLVERASAVDNGQLNLVLARREELIKFVDHQFIATELAVDVLTRESGGELWWRYDFMRFDGKQLCRLLKKTERTSDWPESLKACFKAQGKPLTHGDLLEIAIDNPSAVIELLSTDWASAMEDDQFGKLVTVCVRKDNGRQAITSRLRSTSESWKDLGIEKLKQLLIAFPDTQSSVDWKLWPFATIASLIEANSAFANLNPHPIRFFFWKHAKSLVAMVVLTAAAFCLISYQNEYLAKKESQRQHWNGIVDNIRKLDQSKSYDELSTAFSGVSAMDMSVVSNDVFVKNAAANLDRWKTGRESVSRSMNQLRAIRDKGWQEATPSEVTNLIVQVETCEYSGKTITEECSDLKSSWNRYLKEVEERKRCANLRNSLKDIRLHVQEENDVAKLEHCSSVVSEAKTFDELKGLASEVGTLVDNRIATLRKMALAKSVAVVSNGVEQICSTLCSQDGFDGVQMLPTKRDQLKNELGYELYCKENRGRFEEMSAAIAQFQEMKIDSDEKLREAKRLDEQFKKEFMTIEAGVTCSNLIVGCEAGIEKAKRLGGWKAPMAAYAAIKQIVNGIQSRDVRCWNLVDELNGSTTYAHYLWAKNALVKEYANLAQLNHLVGLGKVSASDAESYFKASRKSFWGSEDKYRYHFVGVIRLAPEDIQSVCINVNNKSQVTSRADLYTLMPGRNAAVSSKLLIRQTDNKYYRVDGVDYNGYQGAPLFVRSEHFIGGEK